MIPLDRLRRIRYTHRALIELSALTDSNALDADWFDSHSDPKSCLQLLWCGLIDSYKGEDQPTVDELADLLAETDLEFMQVLKLCLDAWRRAMGITEDMVEEAEKKRLQESTTQLGTTERNSLSNLGSTPSNGGTGSQESSTNTRMPSGVVSVTDDGS